MSGTHAGGLKAAETMRDKFGSEYWASIGAKGGSKKTTKPKGFAAVPGLASRAGAIGGRNKAKA